MKVKEYLAPTIVLVIICLVVTAALAVTYQVTKPIIEAINIKNANEARAEVLPDGAGGFTAAEGTFDEGIVDYYAADNGAGVAITSEDKGFGGVITVMTGISADGAITGVKVTSHAETPGLGTKAMTPEYLSQYIGLTKITRTEEADATQIDAITGATITSEAVFRSVNKALAQFGETGGASK